jgi:hypothetical protein
MKEVFLIICFIGVCAFSQAQNVGIGTTTPLARLHVVDSSVVFSAVGLALVNPGNPPIQGGGRRMMWFADKAAFRAGYASGTEWDKNHIGKYSFATGYGVTASGDWSFSAGLNSNASAQNSVAIGYSTLSNSNFAIAMGSASFATNDGAVAIGISNAASGKYSLVLGYNNIVKTVGGTVLGQYNDASDNPNLNDTSSLDRIFQIGNGYYAENIDEEVRSNAITVLRNGNTGIGTLLPVNKLDVAGDINLTGKLKVNGNTGTAGQFLKSNGSGAAASWQSPTYKQVFMHSLDALITTGTTFRYAPISAGPQSTVNSNTISLVEYIMPHAGRIDSLFIQATTVPSVTTYGGPSTITISVLKNGVGVGFSPSITAQPVEGSVAGKGVNMGISFAAGDRLCYYYIWSDRNTPVRVNCSMAVSFN